jgi:arabinan endo-1,5-alpha-L-arabinosidase
METKAFAVALLAFVAGLGCESTERGDDGPAMTNGSGGVATSSGGNTVGTGGPGLSPGGASVGGASTGGALESGGSRAGGSSGAAGAPEPRGTNAGGSSGGDAGPDDRCSVARAVPGAQLAVLPMSGDLGTHDPSVIAEDGLFYELQTGPGLPGKTSTDLAEWRGAQAAFPNGNPSWIATSVPGATDLWAPDLSYFGVSYHLYYSASTFGVNTSCIGHATRARMDTGGWNDQGSVICSARNDDFNAIDPNVVVDTNGTPWLAFGSFWSGIKIAKLFPSGARADTTLYSIASRGGGAIEAPYIVRRCGYYYLFVSFDACCKGAQSTYNVRVGRSTNLLGPYADRDGTAMMDGGGTVILSGKGNFAAAGHNAVLFDGDRGYNVFHAYPTDGSYARLRVAEMVWDDAGWPSSGGP